MNNDQFYHDTTGFSTLNALADLEVFHKPKGSIER